MAGNMITVWMRVLRVRSAVFLCVLVDAHVALHAHGPDQNASQLILWLASGVSNEGRSSRVLVLVPPFLGPGFRLGARWNRLGETVKTRKKREKTGKKWARYGLKGVNQGS